MSDYRYVLYDTAVFTVAGAANFILFQVGEGVDATHPETITNMRGNGSLPTEEKFTLQKIHVWREQSVAVADLFDLTDQNILELRLSDKTVLKLPLRMCVSNEGWVGDANLAAGAETAITGNQGWGYDVLENIEIPGGTRFSVRVHQEAGLAATCRVKVALEGVLSMP